MLFPRALTGVAACLLGLAARAHGQDVSFQRDILPLFSDRCFTCHGPDAAGRKADLRLDVRASLFGDRSKDAVVAPGDVDASELIARITSEFESELMPPLDSNLSLTAGEIDLVRRWVEQGAPWDEHWAFVAPERPALPSTERTSWARSAIDRIVLAALEADGLAPSAEAAPSDLLRRVTLDLTGLPPTPAELDAFLADPSDAAYARAVDRLLASPRYGERMAWEWLDAARYADTDGFQADPTRAMWPWRDWLVDALNRNVPFDRFTHELLAGDLLPDATEEQVLASGFHRNHMVNGEGGRIPEETRVENVFDRVETTATTWLGLTVGCARCHDHRYDPISQAEYYQLYDFFNQTSENGRGASGRAPPTLRYLSPTQRTRLTQIEAEAAQLDRERREPSAELDAAQAKWEAEALVRFEREPEWSRASELGPWWQTRPYPAPGGDGSTLFAHAFTPEGGVDLEANDPDGSAVWTLAAGLREGEPYETSPTVSATYFYREVLAPTPRRLTLSLGSDDAIRVWVNGVDVLSRNVARGVAPDQERVTVDLEAGRSELLLKIVNTGGRGGVYFRRASETVLGLPAELARALAVSAEERSAEERAELTAHFRAAHSTGWQRAESRLTELATEAEALRGAAPVVMVMDALPVERRRETRVLARGSYEQPLDPVAAATPAFLPPLPEGAPRDRLGLARWLTDPDHPLTARVTVNRYWQSFFGRGLVATTEDFGRQGETPSHPELLDWLAREFIDSGWDVKAMHRLIVTSATYRQSSSAAVEAYRADPDNERLARGPRYRLPSWMIRDQALALGGLLKEELGGPPVRPYQPDGVWAEATFGTIRYVPDTGTQLYRRSLYVFWRRIVRPTFFFDTSKRQVCEVGRSLTNTPLHALITLNEPAYVEAARCFAARAWTNGGADARTRIAWAFRAATARAPAGGELDILFNRWAAAREHFTTDPEAATGLLGVGNAPIDPTLPTGDLAALTVVCSVLLNLDEVLSKP